MPGQKASEAMRRQQILTAAHEVAESAAFHSAYGAGCNDRPGAFYELFEPAVPTRFDLSNTVFRMTPNGDAYSVAATAATIVPPVSAPLTNASGAPLGDDARTAPKPLGFTFPYSGGSTTVLQ